MVAVLVLLALVLWLATYARPSDAFKRMETGPYSGLAKELGFRRFPRRPGAD
jgi:hypothetical protein